MEDLPQNEVERQMTDIRTIIAELRELEAKATPGKWLYQKDPGIVGHKEPDLLYIGNRPIFVNEPIYNIADYDLCIAVYSRNALPHLLAYIEKLEAVASAAEDFRDASFLGAVNADDFRVRLESTLSALGCDE